MLEAKALGTCEALAWVETMVYEVVFAEEIADEDERVRTEAIRALSVGEDV